MRVLHNLFYGELQYEGLIQIWPAELSIYNNRQTERSLAWGYLTNQSASSLFVKFSIVEAIETVKNINSMAGKNIACFVISEGSYESNKDLISNYLSDKELFVFYLTDKYDPGNRAKRRFNRDVCKNFNNYYVLVTTHEMYIGLADISKYPDMIKEREYFTIYNNDKRRNLIIDEEIGLFDSPISINSKILNKLMDDLPKKYCKDYNKIIFPIKQGLIDHRARIVNANNEFTTKTIYYQDMISSKTLDCGNYIDNFKILIERIRIDKEIKEDVKNKMLQKLEEIMAFYYTDGIYIANNDTIYYLKQSIDYWMLDNTIIMDANGRFSEIYKCKKANGDRRFYVHDIPMCKDYTMFTINQVKTNYMSILTKAKLKYISNRRKVDRLHEALIAHLINHNKSKIKQ